MPDQEKTEIIVLLDRSGSMTSIREDMIGGFGAFIADQRGIPGRCDVSLYTFDTIHETEYEGRSIAAVPRLRLEPRGSTALFDAVCLTIDRVGLRLRGQRPCKVVFVVITDGHENASRKFRAQDVKARIEARHDWQFVFLGANIDAFEYAERMGVQGSGTRAYVANEEGVERVYRETSSAVSAYRKGLRSKVSFEPSLHYSEEPKPETEEP